MDKKKKYPQIYYFRKTSKISNYYLYEVMQKSLNYIRRYYENYHQYCVNVRIRHKIFKKAYPYVSL